MSADNTSLPTDTGHRAGLPADLARMVNEGVIDLDAANTRLAALGLARLNGPRRAHVRLPVRVYACGTGPAGIIATARTIVDAEFATTRWLSLRTHPGGCAIDNPLPANRSTPATVHIDLLTRVEVPASVPGRFWRTALDLIHTDVCRFRLVRANPDHAPEWEHRLDDATYFDDDRDDWDDVDSAQETDLLDVDPADLPARP